MRIVYLGTPAFAATIFKALAASRWRPVGVVTQTAKPIGRSQTPVPTPTEQAATAEGIPVWATDSINSPESLAQLTAWAPDLLVVAAFGQILKEPVLTLPKKYCLNVHGSLLPRYRGAAPIQRAIADGLTETGMTIQKMVRKLDAGDIVYQNRFPILPTDNSATLMDRAALEGGKALLAALELIEKDTAVFTPQNESEATHAAKLTKEEGVIQWDMPASKVACWVRAALPWPVAETRLQGVRLKVFAATPVPGKAGAHPGKIETDSKTYLHVACSEGTALSLTEIQLENKKRLSVKEFLAGYRGSFPVDAIG